jgi:hypothetical protein
MTKEELIESMGWEYENTEMSARFVAEHAVNNMYSEEDLKNAFLDGWQLRDGDLPFPKAKKKWFNGFKKKQL